VDNPLEGIGKNLVAGMAGAISEAAAGSILGGTDFGDNLMAAIPDVIGSTIGNLIGDTLASGSTRRRAMSLPALNLVIQSDCGQDASGQSTQGVNGQAVAKPLRPETMDEIPVPDAEVVVVGTRLPKKDWLDRLLDSFGDSNDRQNQFVETLTHGLSGALRTVGWNDGANFVEGSSGILIGTKDAASELITNGARFGRDFARDPGGTALKVEYGIAGVIDRGMNASWSDIGHSIQRRYNAFANADIHTQGKMIGRTLFGVVTTVATPESLALRSGEFAIDLSRAGRLTDLAEHSSVLGQAERTIGAEQRALARAEMPPTSADAATEQAVERSTRSAITASTPAAAVAREADIAKTMLPGSTRAGEYVAAQSTLEARAMTATSATAGTTERSIAQVRAVENLSPVGRAAEDVAVAGRTYEGGAHGRLSAERGVIERHHAPADSVSPYTTYSGPAIQMDYADHLLTSSHGSQGLEGALYRADVKALIDSGNMRGAMAKEIWDIRRVSTQSVGSPTKYNAATRQMLDYAYSKGFLNKGP